MARIKRSPLGMDDPELPERQEDPLDIDDGPAPAPVKTMPTATIDPEKNWSPVAFETEEPPLITPRPRPYHNHAQERAIVVTVTSTQNITDPNPPPDSGGELPLGIIIGSVLGGVLIAGLAVGFWYWRSKRKRKQRPGYRKGHGSHSSATPLNAAASNGAEKPNRQGAPGGRGATPNSSLRPSASNNSFGSSNGRGPAAGNFRPPPVNNVPPPSGPYPPVPHPQTAGPAGVHPEAPAVHVIGPTGVPGSIGHNYAPVRSSPLVQGAPVRAGPRDRLNDWAVPVEKPHAPNVSPSPASALSHDATTITTPGAPSSVASSSSTPAAYHLSPAAIAKQREATRVVNRVSRDEEQGPAPPYSPPAQDQLPDRDNRVSTQSAISAVSRYTDGERPYDSYYEQHDGIGVAYGGDDQEHHYPPQQGGAVSTQPYAAYSHHYNQQHGYQQGYDPYNTSYTQQPYNPYAHQQQHQQPR